MTEVPLISAAEVIVTNPEPLPVIVASTPPALVTKGEGTTLAPTTTEQEDVVTFGQRVVNLIWEATQAIIALTVVGFTMTKAFSLEQGQDIPTIMAVAFGTIVGFYFARTNHQSIGGIGKKANADEEYRGR